WSETTNNDHAGNGRVSIGRAQASPTIDRFADWMVNEGVIASKTSEFAIAQPRSQATELGASSEEFVYLTNASGRVQQFSFNTPYGAPASDACGRVAYSGFHVAAAPGQGDAPYAYDIFPEHCEGD